MLTIFIYKYVYNKQQQQQKKEEKRKKLIYIEKIQSEIETKAH